MGTFRTMVFGLLAFVALCSSVACEPIEDGPRPKARGLDAESPHLSEGELRKGRIAIVGKVRAVCDKAPEAHELVVVLQRRVEAGGRRPVEGDEPRHR